MSHARQYRRYLRWARYIQRNEKHDARRTMGWVRSMGQAARVNRQGQVSLPRFGATW